MARFRTYKNGIVGHRYKGLYVIREKKEGKSVYRVINDERASIIPSQKSYWDCEWEIDKYMASEKELQLMRKLYEEEIYTLNQFFFQFLQKKEMTYNERIMYDLVEKVRSRKAKGLPF